MKHKPAFSLAFVLIAWAVCTSAQDRSFGTLPLARSANPAMRSELQPPDSAAYQKALQVYNRLVQARGDFRFPVPAFTMTREEQRVAGIDYDLLEIVLEEKAFEVCADFDQEADAAIAFLLGHELTHYYEKHAWRRGFVADYQDLNISLKLDSLIDGAANETEADYLGGFLAYSAGYGLFDKGPELIKRLYAAYGLPSELPGYPSLEDRQTLGLRSAEKLARLTEAFDMANLLTALGKYPEAYAFYRFILMQYQSREIYNNLGVTAILDALQYFPESELKFRFPVELDLESTGEKNIGKANDREKILRQAILHLDAAIGMDPDYAPAYLNKACAYALLGDDARARFYAEVEGKQAAQRGEYRKTETDIAILLGILEDRAGNAAGAESAFEAAAKNGNALAAANLKILLKEPIEPEKPSFRGSRPERIDDQTIDEISNDFLVDSKRSLKLDENFSFHQNPGQGNNSALFVCQNNRSRTLILLHLTGPGYKAKTARKIGLGDDRTSIINAYGLPVRAVETTRGEILVYNNILFILGADGRLSRWGTYQ